jgi:hypothetical protein
MLNWKMNIFSDAQSKLLQSRLILKTTSNYTVWCNDLSATLQSQGLFEYAFGRVNEPTKRGGETNASLDLQKDKYKQKLQQTAGYIQICLDRPFHTMVRGHKMDLVKMIKILKANLVPKVNMSKLTLLMQLVNLRRKSGEALNSYFSQISDLTTELMCNGLELPSVFTLMVILNGLPTKYNTVQPIIESQPKIDLNDAMCRLHDHEANLNARSEQTEAINVMKHNNKPGQLCRKWGGASKSDKANCSCKNHELGNQPRMCTQATTTEISQCAIIAINLVTTAMSVQSLSIGMGALEGAMATR